MPFAAKHVGQRLGHLHPLGRQTTGAQLNALESNVGEPSESKQKSLGRMNRPQEEDASREEKD